MNHVLEKETVLSQRTDLRLMQDKTFREIMQRFLASLDIRKSSKETYKRGLKRFLKWLISEVNITRPRREDILAYKDYLKTRNLSSLTLSNYLVVVRRFFEWTEGMKLYPNIAKGVKGARHSRNIRKDPLTVEQVKELLNGKETRVSTPQVKRDYAILNLLVRTGLRTIEVIRADVGDIRQESGEAVLWIQGKGCDVKDEFVLLTNETLKPINEYLETRGELNDNDALFASLSDRNKGKRLTTQSIRKMVKKHLREIGLNNKRLSAHSLRHTAITLSLQAGATIQEAQALGRHANINTTLIYAHNIDRISNAPEKRIDALLAKR